MRDFSRLSSGHHKFEILRIEQALSTVGVKYSFPSAPELGTFNLSIGISGVVQNLSARERDFIAAASTLIIAGLFRPRFLELKWKTFAAASDEFHLIMKMLYDIRAYCEKDDPFYPDISLSAANEWLKSPDMGCKDRPDYDHLVLFSGGIDSSFALKRLVESDHKPLALYMDMNLDTRDLERNAAKNVTRNLEVPLIELPFSIEGFPIRDADPFLWGKFGQFPYYNSIPHGRDILSIAVACIIASRLGVKKIALGQEKESKQKLVTYRDHIIHRHDVESNEGSRLINLWVNKCISDELTIYSPIEDFTIEEIRLIMIKKYPVLFSLTQSCFWERLCCRCVKCVSLYIIQRISDREIFNFPINPLADHTNHDLADAINNNIPDNEIGYGAQIRNGIRRILAAGNYSSEDYWIIKAATKFGSSRFVDGGEVLNEESAREGLKY